MKSIAFVLVAVMAGLVSPSRSVGAAGLEKDDRPGQRTTPVQPRVHRGDDWGIAAPGSWGTLKGAPPPVTLYLIGDGREGVPMYDGILSALKAGLQVEVLADRKDSLKEHVAKDVKELKESGAFEPLQEPEVK